MWDRRRRRFRAPVLLCDWESRVHGAGGPTCEGDRELEEVAAGRGGGGGGGMEKGRWRKVEGWIGMEGLGGYGVGVITIIVKQNIFSMIDWQI